MVILKPALPKDTDEFITLQRRWLLFVFTAALHLPHCRCSAMCHQR
jgi:hypothetical protein